MTNDRSQRTNWSGRWLVHCPRLVGRKPTFAKPTSRPTWGDANPHAWLKSGAIESWAEEYPRRAEIFALPTYQKRITITEVNRPILETLGWRPAIGPMSHSVESHLRLDIVEYDELIRRFIPGYDEMLNELADYLAFHLVQRERPLVLDLGTGTGSLAALVLKRIPKASVIGIDTDPAMIVEARKRLADLLPRVTHLLGDFFGPLPHGSDACMASLALHHIRELTEKRRLYRKILGALGPRRHLCERRRHVCRKRPAGIVDAVGLDETSGRMRLFRGRGGIPFSAMVN